MVLTFVLFWPVIIAETMLQIAGVPLVVLAGIGAILTSIFLYWAFFHYAFFGLQAKQNISYWVGGAVLFGLLWYIGARLVRRQEGIDIDRVYAEIPPE
jgi:hypothetical protein